MSLAIKTTKFHEGIRNIGKMNEKDSCNKLRNLEDALGAAKNQSTQNVLDLRNRSTNYENVSAALNVAQMQIAESEDEKLTLHNGLLKSNDALVSTKAEYDKIIANNQAEIYQMKVSNHKEMTLEVKAKESKIERISSLEDEMRIRVGALVEENTLFEKNMTFNCEAKMKQGSANMGW
eukprot:CAMPEP_0194317734 /NCGR_PEP_ID=MMETSP0171-20130528/14468_1 /TAXON_ID=218684 /ORGANISM="Corethron pennatum, Strain L29A3" /LENGTH=177 /DNA_ID=CAMNT_0039074441 /DNA_START=844 /DNA_END=1374 /DNA_ORIENTATION=+